LDILILGTTEGRNVFGLVVLQPIRVDIIFIIWFLIAGEHVVVIVIALLTILPPLGCGSGGSTSPSSFNVRQLTALPPTTSKLVKVGAFMDMSLFTVFAFVAVAFGSELAAYWRRWVDADMGVKTLVVGASTLKEETASCNTMGVRFVRKVAGVAFFTFALHKKRADCYLGWIVRVGTSIAVVTFS
jgi:hypothetical protein